MKINLVSAAVIIALSGCGGGDGGSSATLGPIAKPPDRTVPFHAPVRINSFQPHENPRAYVTPGPEIYARDLNGNGSDEVIWSNVAFDYSGQDWHYSRAQIFGFNTGTFANETDLWFAPGHNVYTGGFRINFGDFNGSGRTDVFLATFTDTPNYTGPSILLENTTSETGGVSQFTRRVIDFGVNLHSHDSVVADFNGDGIDDVLMTDSALMLGSRTGDYVTYLGPRCCAAGSVVGAGLSAADYMGDGTVTVVVTDGPGMGGDASDTILYRPRIENDALVMEQLAVLPTDRFWLPKWQELRDSGVIHGHAVRNIAMDFDGDGRPDVVVFSTAEKDGNVHGWTEVQFLRNDGGGVFTDVTDSVLVGFEHGKTVTYNPVLMDVNNDGLVDILMSVADYTGQPSTSVLLATREGKFVESYIQVFEAFNQQIRTLAGPGAGTNLPVSIVADGDKRYLISGVPYEQGGIARVAVYASLIGSMGTVNAQATIDAVRQIWPWMSAADASEVLNLSAVSWVDGFPVIDLQRALQPVGSLGIALSDRHSTRSPIQGMLRAPGLDTNKMIGITAVDDLGRDFRVDLDWSAQDHHAWQTRFTQTQEPGISWGMRNFYQQKYTNGIWAVQTDRIWGWAMNTSILGRDSPWQQYVSVLRTPHNPWIQMSGMYGEIKHAVTIESGMMYKHSNGAWAQIATMQTSTDFRPGLVSGISPIWSVHGSMGWRSGPINMFAGVLPTIIQGKLDLRLPDQVDHRGVLHYRQESVKLRNPATMFVGLQHSWENRNLELRTRLSVTDQARYDAGIEAKIRF